MSLTFVFQISSDYLWNVSQNILIETISSLISQFQRKLSRQNKLLENFF